MPLIVISGVDGTGKTTQVNMLTKRASETGKEFNKDFISVKFPRYDHPSAKMVELYLRGEFGKKPDDTPVYLASTFYAIDRALSFQHERWGEFYREGKLVISDRFYESNVIHQVAKQIRIDSDPTYIEFMVSEFLRFINTIECKYLKVPKPDLIIFLSMNRKVNWKLLQDREHGMGDIHERDYDYFSRCHNIIDALRNNEEFKKRLVFIDTYDAQKDQLRTPEDIHEEIFSIIQSRKLI